jgi:plasmid stabilization system protein ParE
MVTVWTPKAISELRSAYIYIRNDSPQSALAVMNNITTLADQLANHPEMFPPDKFKINNDGNWRAFEKHRYRITYHVTPNEIRIVRMRHTSRTPLRY